MLIELRVEVPAPLEASFISGLETWLTRFGARLISRGTPADPNEEHGPGQALHFPTEPHRPTGPPVGWGFTGEAR